MSNRGLVHFFFQSALVLALATSALGQGNGNGGNDPAQPPGGQEALAEAEPCLEGCDSDGGVSVTPDGTVAAAVSPYGANYKLSFTVSNSSTQSLSLSFACADETTVICSKVSPSSTTLGAGNSTDVVVTYSPTGETGSRQLHLEASGDAYDFGYYIIPLADSLTAPLVDVSPHNGENLDHARCVLDCLHMTLAYSTPAYFSLDTPRSATVFYRSEQAAPRPFVQVEATDTSETAASMYSIQLRRAWDLDNTIQTLLGGHTEVHFSRDVSGTNRLAAQFDGSNLPTGAYAYDVIIRSHWPNVVRERVVPVTVLVVNEKNSSFGWGWSLPGLQQIHFNMEGVEGVVVTDGTGSAALFIGSCSFSSNCTFASPAGDFSTLTYSASASTFFREWPNGTTAAFQSDGKLAYVQDRFGNRTRYAWSGNLLNTITDPGGKVIEFGYGGDGLLDWIESADGRYSYFTHNLSKNLTAIQDPSGSYALSGVTYDGSHRITAYADRRGNTWSVAYDLSYRLVSMTAPYVHLNGSATDSIRPVTTYFSAERRLWQSNASTSGTYDNPRGARTAAQWRHEVTSPRGVMTRSYLDRWRQAIQIQVTPGTSLARSSTFAYDANGLLTRSQDALGRVVRNTWSGHLLTQVLDSTTGRTATTTYDATRYFGVTRTRQFNVTAGDTAEVTYSLNSLGLPAGSVRTSDPDVASSWTYDSRGRVLTSTDPEGHATSWYYQSGGSQNTDSVVNPRRFATRYHYDAAGRTLHVVNAEFDTVTTQYDELNRVTSTNTPYKSVGAITTTSYLDSIGQVVITDAISQSYTFQYDALGRLDWERDPRGGYLAYGYDRIGNQTYFRNRRSQDVLTAYDTLNRVVTRTADGRTTNFAYYGIADSSVAWNDADRVAIRLDALGRPDTVSFLRGSHVHRVTYRYDPVQGTLTNAQLDPHVGLPRSTSYQWDRFRQLAAAGADSLGYDNDRLTTALRLPNEDQLRQRRRDDHAIADGMFYDDIGQPKPALDAALARRYVRDDFGRITGRFGPLGADTLGSTFDYTKAGRLRSELSGVRCAGSWSWSDADGYACSDIDDSRATGTGYGWDQVGNPTHGNATVTTGNRLTAMDGYSFEYDADGNVTRKYGNGLDRRYYWNSLAQLDSVFTSGVGTVAFGYGPFGSRVWREAANGAVTHYVYDRGNLAAELDATGAPIRVYSYYPGLDVPRTVEIGGAYYHYVRELPNHVIGLIDVSGAVVQTYEYGPFGEDRGATGTIAQPLRYGARELDDDIGLYYNRARWYDPEIGRFIAEDPIRLGGGINLYAYTGGNPINATDPTGTRMRYVPYSPPMNYGFHLTTTNFDELLLSLIMGGVFGNETWGTHYHSMYGGSGGIGNLSAGDKAELGVLCSDNKQECDDATVVGGVLGKAITDFASRFRGESVHGVTFGRFIFVAGNWEASITWFKAHEFYHVVQGYAWGLGTYVGRAIAAGGVYGYTPGSPFDTYNMEQQASIVGQCVSGSSTKACAMWGY